MLIFIVCFFFWCLTLIWLDYRIWGQQKLDFGCTKETQKRKLRTKLQVNIFSKKLVPAKNCIKSIKLWFSVFDRLFSFGLHEFFLVWVYLTIFFLLQICTNVFGWHMWNHYQTEKTTTRRRRGGVFFYLFCKILTDEIAVKILCNKIAFFVSFFWFYNFAFTLWR